MLRACRARRKAPWHAVSPARPRSYHCGVRRIPATCREGVRRVTVAPQHRKESNADAGRRCTQNTRMLPCGSKPGDHAFDLDGHALAASSHRRSRGPVPIRVFCVHRLAASVLKLLLWGAAGRCWRTHCQARIAAHASGATPWHGARVWRPVLVVANGCAALTQLPASDGRRGSEIGSGQP